MKPERTISRWSDFLTTALTVGVVLLPRLTCPCQYPAYAGLLGSVGLAYVPSSTYLFPLTAFCLTLVVGGLALQARQRWGYGPFVVGLAAAGLLVVGKFLAPSSWLYYTGFVLLLIASIWNSLPRRPRPKLRFTPDGAVLPPHDSSTP